jgi:hypothetical protein
MNWLNALEWGDAPFFGVDANTPRSPASPRPPPSNPRFRSPVTGMKMASARQNGVGPFPGYISR